MIFSKRFFTLLPVVLFFSSFMIMSGIEEIVAAMKTGDVLRIAKFFDTTVEITLPDNSNSYSKSQAQMVLKDFFATNQVKDFNILHEGENGGSQYCIGTLQTANGDFRTTIFMKQKDNTQVLQELRFENK